MRSRDSVAAWMVLATVAISVFAIGGSTRPTALLSAALGVACALPYLTSRRGFSRTPALIALIGVAFAVTLLQVIPLPLGLVSILSPHKAELVRANAAALGEAAPGFTPLSLEPSATWLAVAMFVGYLGCAVAAVRVGATSRGRTILARGLVAIAASVAIVAVVHQVAGAKTLFGYYTPVALRGEPSFLAPLMNPNHLAGFLAVATPIAIALAFTTAGSRRLLWGASAVLCFAVALALESRTASIALLVGIATVTALIFRIRLQGRRRGRNQANRAAGLVIATVLFAAALIYFGRGAATEIAGTDADEISGDRGKLAVWSSSTSLLWEHRIVGVGRGAFEQAFTPRLHQSPYRHSHVENEYLQTPIDFGIPASLLMLALLGVALRVALKRGLRTPLEAGLTAAIIAAAVHHIADFAIELPGPAYFVLVAFAALSRGELVTASKKQRLSPRASRGLALAAAAALVAIAASPIARGPRPDSATLAKDRDKPRELERAVQTWRRHPADYIIAGQVSDALRRAGDERAFRVASRALTINPTHWQLHLTVARMLLQTSRPQQALGEYRLAIEHGPDRMVRGLLRELIANFPDPEIAVRGLPLSLRRTRILAIAFRQLEAPALGLAFFRAMSAEAPSNSRIQLQLARFALDRRDWSLAAEAAKRSLKLGERGGASLAAKALVRAGQPQDAATLLDSTRADTAAPPAKKSQAITELVVLAQAHVALEQYPRAEAAMISAIDLLGRNNPAAARHFLYLAKIQVKMGHPHQAAENREAAARLGGKP